MGFFGAVSGMKQSLKENKKLLKKRDGYFDKDLEKEVGVYGKFTDHTKMSSAQFVAFQQKVREENARVRKKQLLILSVIMSLVLSVLGYFLYY